ncbi:hypothetical protein AKO1_007086 [Acrasis kona]|uniref:Carrier domain-containing protein n=1 Tax=Acrasis kona TaxID=1008807 RepID=A0AAW2YSZ9_9EUKA
MNQKMNYQLLNVENEFDRIDVNHDLIIAANVIHATKLDRSIPYLVKLIGENNVLIMLEVTRPMLFLDITFGLTDGWWRRDQHPLLSFESWKLKLSEHDLKVEKLNDRIEFQSVMIITSKKNQKIDDLIRNVNHVIDHQDDEINVDSSQNGQNHHHHEKNNNGLIRSNLEEFEISKLDWNQSSPTQIKSILNQSISKIIHQTLDLQNDLIVDPSTSLSAYGMDSLLGLELRNILNQQFQINIKLKDLINNEGIVSIDALSTIIIECHNRSHPSSIESNSNHDDDHNNIYMNMGGTNPQRNFDPSSLTSNQKNDENLIKIQMERNQSNEACILSMGTSLPENQYTQLEMANHASKYYQLDSTLHSKLHKVYQSSNIRTRHSVMDFDQLNYSQLDTFTSRNEIYEIHSTKLAVASCKEAIRKWGGDVKQITHVVSVSTTGQKIPGIEFELVQLLNLKHDVQRVAINFMGCFGAMPGLKTANAFARENPNHRVLLVCTEICSTHIEKEATMENFVSSAIFADGSGAAIIGQPNPQFEFENPKYRIVKFSSYAVADSMDKMYWKVTDKGWRLGLSREIPDLIFDNLYSFLTQLLSYDANQLKRLDCDWSLHPGGKAILVAIENALGLSKQQTNCSWDVMSRCGNMSSATIMFVLEQMCDKVEQKSKYNCCMVFGPGLTIEGCVLEKYE